MITRLLCRLGLHKWVMIFGLSPVGYRNYRCTRCGAKRYRRYHWEREHG